MKTEKKKNPKKSDTPESLRPTTGCKQHNNQQVKVKNIFIDTLITLRIQHRHPFLAYHRAVIFPTNQHLTFQPTKSIL